MTLISKTPLRRRLTLFIGESLWEREREERKEGGGREG